MGEDHSALMAELFPTAVSFQVETLNGGVVAATEMLELTHDTGRRERLLLRKTEERSFKPSEQMGMQLHYALLEHLHALGLPVPKPRHVDETCQLLSGPFLIYEFIDGESRPPDQPAMLKEMAHTLARIHGVRTESVPPGLPSRTSPLSGLAEWVDDRLFEEVKRLHRERASSALLHGDFWPGNLLWRDGSLVAVIDWEDAALGDPISDVACARVELRCAVGKEASEHFTDAYLAATGHDGSNLASWDIYVASAALSSMDAWGLAPDALSRRRANTEAFLQEAQHRL